MMVESGGIKLDISGLDGFLRPGEVLHFWIWSRVRNLLLRHLRLGRVLELPAARPSILPVRIEAMALIGLK